MSGDNFSPEQQEYLKGFMSGVEARRGSLAPSAEPAPADALGAAQARTQAAGGKLVAEEKAKADRNPLDRWPEVTARAAEGRFPKGVDVFLTKYHGLFYVAPAQDSFMCRLRIPGGILSAWQLAGVADIAEDCAGGYADITTRANLQLREIPAAKGPEVVMRLGEIGLGPRGTGADNIRNITASPTAGIDPQELIDSRPQVRALHHHILNTRDLYSLPRKFNIAVNGGGLVETLEETNDISLAAIGTPGGVAYRLGLGGITGHQDFARGTGVVVAPADVVPVCDAILRVFIAHGDRTDRKKARLKYLLDRWGLEKFLDETEALLGRALTRVATDAMHQPAPPAKHGHVGAHAQRQPGLNWIGIVVPVGRLAVAQLRGLADIATCCGSGDIRLTVWQNLLLPDIPDARLAEAQDAIAALGLATRASFLQGGLVACTGSAGSKFALAATKRHAREIGDFLDTCITVDQPVNIHVTGCTNSCAQHFVADIGLLGARVEQGEDTVDGYDLHVGGGAGPEQRIGRLIRRGVPATDIAPPILALLRAWMRDRAPGETLQAFTARFDDTTLAAMAEAAVLEDA